MHCNRRAGLVTLLGTLLALPWGCGSGGGGASIPTTGPDVFYYNSVQEAGDIYRIAAEETKKPPTRLEGLAKYENGFPVGYAALKKEDIVVFWGAPLSDSAAGTVLAYEKGTPGSGGYALMQDGKTIRKMTAEEFQAAPKAGKLEAKPR